MAMTPRLDLRQSQTLVMTPQLQQAIKLLQLSNLDLVAFVEQQLESNPLLERASAEAPILEAEGMADARERPEAPVLDALPGTASEAPVDHAFNTDRDEQGPSDGVGTSSADGATGADGAEDGSLSWSSSTGSGGAGGSFDEDGGAGLEAMLSEATTLSDHIEAQIGVDITDGADRLIALHLAGQLEETGWLSGSLDDAAAMLGCPLADVERVLARLQRMDPPGVFARSLAECLALQLADRDRLDPAMAALLANLDRLAKREFTQLMQICGVDKEDLLDMIQEIRALDPKPGLRFQHETVQTMVPDVVMRPDPAADTAEGGWLVELNTETLPRVLVNMRYFARLNRGRRDKDAKTFITEQLQSANWLVKSLDQRANTILKVATEIVRLQDSFFAKGVRHLRPLILRDIAEAIEMHESTVSRVTNNKFIATPRGVFELKYFFTQAIGGTDGGDAHSAEAVRDRIRTMIDAEPPKAILSDDKIVEILKADGIDIARRTVAKYREAMKIPSSIQRRREKSAALT